MLKQSKGITLVALVVTIIVLIILASVSINLVLGENGLVQKAKEASRIQEKAELIEQMQMEIIEIEADRIEVGEDLSQKAVEKILSKYGTVNKNSDGTIKSLIPKDREYEILFEEIYSETLEENITISDLEEGDYIKYNTGKTEIGENGIVLCRVLYNDEANGLQIVTDKNITQKVDGVDVQINVTLGGSDWETGKAAYNSAIEDLNNEAEKYLNTAYAYDARCVGSAPTVENGRFINKDKVKFEGTTEYVVPGTTTVTLPPSTWTSYTRPSGWTSDDTGCYNTDINYTDDQKAMTTAGIWTTGENYWLASRVVHSNSTLRSFNVRFVDSSESLGTSLCDVYSNGSTYGISKTNGLRPCFSLKSDIKVTGEDGKTADTAYVIE